MNPGPDKKSPPVPLAVRPQDTAAADSPMVRIDIGASMSLADPPLAFIADQLVYRQSLSSMDPSRVAASTKRP